MKEVVRCGSLLAIHDHGCRSAPEVGEEQHDRKDEREAEGEQTELIAPHERTHLAVAASYPTRRAVRGLTEAARLG